MKEKPKIQQSKQLILSHKKSLLEFVQLVELIRVQIMFLVDQNMIEQEVLEYLGLLRRRVLEITGLQQRSSLSYIIKKINSKDKVLTSFDSVSAYTDSI